jgi:hypothetical protein
MQPSFQVNFENGSMAQIIEVERQQDLSAAMDAMGLQETRPVLVVIGGASKLGEEDFARLQQLFVEVLAPVANILGCFVVDGGTDAGVMKLMGTARTKTDSTFPLIGVSPIGLVKLPNTINHSSAATALENHHTHFFLVAGSEWGDESPWLAKIASLLAGDKPSVAVLINGGEIALVDATENVKAGRSLLAIEGSGRLADEIAMAISHPEQDKKEGISFLLEQGQITLFALAEPLSQLENILRQKLSGENL